MLFRSHLLLSPAATHTPTPPPPHTHHPHLASSTPQRTPHTASPPPPPTHHLFPLTATPTLSPSPPQLLSPPQFSPKLTQIDHHPLLQTMAIPTTVIFSTKAPPKSLILGLAAHRAHTCHPRPRVAGQAPRPCRCLLLIRRPQGRGFPALLRRVGPCLILLHRPRVTPPPQGQTRVPSPLAPPARLRQFTNRYQQTPSHERICQATCATSVVVSIGSRAIPTTPSQISKGNQPPLPQHHLSILHLSLEAKRWLHLLHQYFLQKQARQRALLAPLLVYQLLQMSFRRYSMKCHNSIVFRILIGTVCSEQMELSTVILLCRQITP